MTSRASERSASKRSASKRSASKRSASDQLLAERAKEAAKAAKTAVALARGALSSDVGAIVVFADGSCLDNGGRHPRAGFATVWPDHPDRDRGWPLSDGVTPTSIRAEMYAWLAACGVADDIDRAQSPAERRTLVVHTDSQFVVDCATSWVSAWARNAWRKSDGEPVANLDLCKRMEAQLEQRAVRTLHVRGHNDAKTLSAQMNARADQLARSAARSQSEV
jgi:ribonuclease HI